jgi:hypothetical protein
MCAHAKNRKPIISWTTKENLRAEVPLFLSDLIKPISEVLILYTKGVPPWIMEKLR